MWQGNAVNVLKGTPQSTLQCLIYAQVRHTDGEKRSSLNDERTGILFPIEELTQSFSALSR